MLFCNSTFSQKLELVFLIAKSDSTGMDPCTLSSIKFFTEGVLIPSPCPRAPESCQNLLFMPEPRFSLFSRASPRSILSTVSRFLSGLRCFLLGRVALLWVSIQWVLCFFFIVASRRKKYDVAPPLKIIRRGWWWAGRGGGGTGGGGPGHCCSYSIPIPASTVSFGVCK